ncbi:MAG: hypothetical protein AAFU79_01705 [Myxococcota bacterium]
MLGLVLFGAVVALPPLARIVRETAQLLYSARRLSLRAASQRSSAVPESRVLLSAPRSQARGGALVPVEAGATWRRTFRLAMFDWAKAGVFAIGFGTVVGGLVAGLFGALIGLSVMGASAVLVALPSVVAAGALYGAAARGVDELDARILRSGVRSLSAGAVAVLPEPPSSGQLSEPVNDPSS